MELVCPDYSKLLEEGICRHLADKELTDVVFNCNGNEIHAHRLMISIFAPELMMKLENPSELTEVELNANSLLAMIGFIYSGRVTVAEDQLEKLKQDAKVLEFELLVDTIEHSQHLMNSNKTVEAEDQQIISEIELIEKNDSQPVIATAIDNELQVEEDRENDSNNTVEVPGLVKRRRPLLRKERTTFIRCADCEFETPSEFLYMRHLKDDHKLNVKRDEISITYRCYKCDFVTENRTKWRTHRATESNRGVFKCTECDKVFNVKVLLDRHVKYNHSTDRPYHCNKCEYKGKTLGLLRDHQKIHQTGSFKCPICNAVFKLKYHLVAHTKRCHISETARTFQCEFCSKKFARRCDLNKHLQQMHHMKSVSTHKPENITVPETCHHCNFKTQHSKLRWVYHLAAKHQKDVDGNRLEANIKCDLCDSAFLIKQQLHQHKMQIHLMGKDTNGVDKPFMCETCGHCMKSRRALAVHAKIHSGLRFPCEICEKTYSSKDHVQKHMKFMHNPNARCHLCHVCNFATKTRWLLREHINRMHKDAVIVENFRN